MRNLTLAAALIVAGGVCGVAMAQGNSAAPAEAGGEDDLAGLGAAPTSSSSRTPASAASGKVPAGYPEAIKKEMHAKTDLRNKKAPAFHVERWLTSEPQRKNKTVLIDFWATWCPPCRALVPELAALQKTFKDDLVVIGVSDEDAKVVADFVDANKVAYAVATDTRGAMKKAVGVNGIPHVLVISSDGIVRWQGFPYAKEEQLTEATLRQIIEADKAARAQREGEKKAKDAAPATDTKAPPAKPEDKKDGH